MDLADAIAVGVVVWVLLACTFWIGLVAWLRVWEMRRRDKPRQVVVKHLGGELPPGDVEMADESEAHAEELARLRRRQSRGG
jgi:hypothetical protein